MGKKILTTIALVAIIAQSFNSCATILHQKAYAQEVDSASSPQAIPTVEQPTPTDTPTETITPASNAADVTPTPTPTDNLPPPAVNSISVAPASASNAAEANTSPTASQEQALETSTGNEQVSITILKNVPAPSIRLDTAVGRNASLTTDKPDYAPTDAVLLTGSNLLPNTTYTLMISSLNEPPIGVSAQVTSDENGKAAYAYQLDGTYRPTYKAELEDQAGAVVASVTFTDHFLMFVSINDDNQSTNNLNVNLNISWWELFFNPIIARYANDLSPNKPLLDPCNNLGGGSWSAWESVSSDKSWVLAAGSNGVRRVCVETAHGTVSSPNGVLSASDTINLNIPADHTPPGISFHDDVTVEAQGSIGTVVSYISPTTSDNVDGPDIAACSPVSGSTFSLGDTTVTCNATDSAGNLATPTTFTVHVTDATAPVFSLPSDITDEATSPSGTTVTYTATASDLVDGSVPVVCAPASGSTFPIGLTTVTCSASDSHGNTDISSFNITVQDTTAPAISITSPSDGSYLKGAVTITASASDVVGVTKVEFWYSPIAVTKIGEGTQISPGAYSIDWNTNDSLVGASDGPYAIWTIAYDSAGNKTESDHVNVIVDNTGPTISASVTPSSPDGLAGWYKTLPVISYACSPDIACPSNFTFGEGTGLNHTETVVDAAGNSTSVSSGPFKVDATAPLFAGDESCPFNKTVDTDPGLAYAIVTYSASMTDNFDGVIPVIFSPASGSQFAAGTVNVNGTAIDSAGNVSTTCTFSVTVTDSEKPTTPGTPTTTSPTNNNKPAWTWTGSTDNVGLVGYTFYWGTTLAAGDYSMSSASLIFTIPSWLPLADGAWYAKVEAVDTSGNNSLLSDVGSVVVDTAAPTLYLSSAITVEATGPSGAVVTYTTTADDTNPIHPTVTCAPNSGSTFALGQTTINCSATDAADNAATESFKITVQDTTALVITAHGDETAEATSSLGAVVNYTSPTTNDIVDGSGTATCTPDSGSTFALGETTVTCSASDSAGNKADSTTFAVHVIDTTPPTTPIADPPGKDYMSNQWVKLSSTDIVSGVDIYYTANGLDPDNTSNLSSDLTPIKIDHDMTIKAIAYDKAGNASKVFEATYGVPPIISGETFARVSDNSLTLSWLTDDSSTSRVVYDTVSHPNPVISSGESPDKYNYANTTDEFDTSLKVTSHSVSITDLTTNVAYYYRVISHGSPEAVGEERTYTINYILGLPGDGKSDGGSTGGGGGAPSLASVLGVSSALAFGGRTREEVLGTATTSASPTPSVSPAQIGPNPVSISVNWVFGHKKISLIIFLVILGTIAYFLYRKRKNF